MREAGLPVLNRLSSQEVLVHDESLQQLSSAPVTPVSSWGTFIQTATAKSMVSFRQQQLVGALHTERWQY